MAENFLIDLIASLKKGDSKRRVREDIKNLGDIKIPLIGTLNKAKTKSRIKQDLSALNGTVDFTGKVDNKRVAASMKQATAQAQKQIDAKPVEMAFSIKKEKLLNDIKLLAKQNSRLFKNADMSIKYNTLLDNAEMSKNAVELSALRTQLGSFRSELKVTGNAGLTMTDALKNGLSKVLQLFGGHGIIMQFTAQLRNAWKEAKELDSSLTSLSKVCDELANRSSFPAYIEKSISKAEELCTDVNDLLYAITEFKKLGNTLEKSEILAEYAIRLQNVGDTDIDTAISSIKTAMASFDEIGGYTDNSYEKKVEAYIDLINNLSNKFSIDAEGLANAIRISAGTLTEANMSIEEVASIISAANRYYDDPDYLANTLKIGSLRLRASKTSDEAKELEALGENIDDLSESTSKLRDEMMALTGVDIMVDDRNFKSYYQQLLDISKVYQTLDETTRANVLEKMFGKNRAAAGANILKAMSDSVEVYNEALQSAGSSEEEFSRWTESAEAATKRFGVAMTETYNSVINGETVKGLTNAATAVLDFANKWGLVEASFKGFLTLGILKAITALTVAFKGSAVQLSNYGSALEAVKKVSTCAQGTRDYADAMKDLKNSCANLTDAQLKHVLANRNLNEEQLKEILQLKDLKKEEIEARLSQLGLTQSTNTNTVSNTANAGSVTILKGAFKGLAASVKETWAAMSALQKAGIIFAAISTAWSVFSAVLSNHKQKLEEARQKAAELAEEYKQQQSSLDSQIEKYRELKESLDSGNLSTDETRSIKEQLLEIQKSLIESYGDEASNLDLVNGKYREQLGLLDGLSKEKANDFIIENRDVYNEAKKALEEVKTYDLGTVTSWSSYVPKTEDQEKLLDFIESYSDLLELSYQGHSTSYNGNGYVAAVNLSVKANVVDADEIMHQFAADLEQYINENNIDVDVSGLLENSIPEQIRNTWTDELKEYREIYDEFIKAEIVRDDTLRPLYQQSIQAVEDYNNALSSGEGVEEAKADLDSVRQSVQNATGELEGSQEIFDEIYGEINKNAEAAYNLNQAFENDETVKGYAEQLRGLNDNDLKAINFEDNVESPGEKAFGALIDILGLSKDEVQNLIDKLIELKYIQGIVNGAIPYMEGEPFNSEADNLFTWLTASKEALDKFQSSVKSAADAYSTLMSGNYSSGDLLDSLQAINEAVTDMGGSLDWELIDSMGESGLYNSLDLLGGAIEYITEKYAESVLSGAGIDVDSKFGQMLANNIIQAQKAGTQLEVLDGQIDSLQSAYSDLTDIVGTYNETGHITFDQLQTLLELEPQYLACLTDENGQLRLNERAVAAIANQRLNDAEAQAVQQAVAELGQIAFRDEQTAVENNGQAFQDQISKIEGYNQTLATTIAEAGIGAAYIRDLNSAIEGAEAQGASDDQIQTVLNNLEIKLQAINGVRDKIANSGSGSVLGNSQSSAKDTAETFDWIEQAIENVEKEIKELDEIVNSSYSTFSQKNEALAQEIGKVSDEIGLQQQAYEEYMRKADSVGLSDHYKQLVQSGAVNIEDLSDKNLQDLISEYQNWYDKAQNVSDAVRELKTDMMDLYVSAYELQTENLKDRLDSDSITQKQYLESLKTAYEQFYANIEDFAEQYHEAVLDYLAEEKDYLNSVGGAAASLADTEIDKIREDADAQEDIIQKQIDLLEAKKKPLKDELDALEDKAKRENLILNLQKAQYELARAENQRTKLVYTSEKGMVYTADPATVRDAQKDVDDAKLEIQKQSIQDQIDALDDEINRYNDLIDQINNAADVQIDALEKIKNKWQEVIDRQEYAKNVSLLTGEFGAGAISKILTGNDDDLLAQWKDSYINTLADIDMESQGYIGNMTEQIASLYGIDLSPLQEQFAGIKDSISGINSAIGSGMNVPNYNADTEDNGNNASPTNLTDSITGVGIAAGQSLPNVTSNMDEIAETATNAASSVTSVTDAINNIPESKDVTISVHTVGVGSVSGGAASRVSQVAYSEAGNAYAKGTRRAEKGLAIVGEEKPEAVVTNDDKVLLADTPALVNMEGGETVYNGDETARMLEALRNPPVLENSLLTDKTWLRRQQQMQEQAWLQNYLSGNRNLQDYNMAGKYIGKVSSVVNNVTNNSPSYNVGDINVTCTGVTSQEVAKQVGAEIQKTFFGIGTDAVQMAHITR